MTLPRVHLFEVNDSAWAPDALRETVVEALSRALAWGRILRGLAAPFGAFLERTGADEVLDLCAGAGAPAAILAEELRRAGREPPRFFMCDLYPRVDSWRRLAARHGSCIRWIEDPVDATRVPAAHAKMPRVVVNALHHFRPALAGAILRDAARSARGVFVAEGFERNPLRFAPFALAGVPALLAGPLLAPRRKVEKALLSWASPVALGVSAWDGVVSTLRVYTERELREMVAGSPLEWTYGTYDFFPSGRGYWFSGVPRSS